MENPRIKELIETLGLEPLEKEGGWFRFISRFGNGAGTIYYLMTETSFSHLHQLTDDEVWYFLEGDRVEQILLKEDGSVMKRILDEDHRVSVVEGKVFQASYLLEPKFGYALVCTAMSPFYRDDMYTHGKDVDWVRGVPEVQEVL